MKFYRTSGDGELKASVKNDKISVLGNTRNLYLGCDVGCFLFNDRIDEVKIWNRVLTREEIKKSYKTVQ